MNTPIIETKSEIGAGTRGASLGIEALKSVSYKKKDSIFKHREISVVEDSNSILYDETDTPWAKNIEHYQVLFNRIQQNVANALKHNKQLFFLSGDHSNAAAIISGIRRQNSKRKLGLIWIDAHADLHSPYTTPSGNMHGMPLSLVLGLTNKPRNTPSPKTREIWDKLFNESKQLASPKMLFIAVRDTESEEDYLISSHQIPNITVDDLKKEGVAKKVDEIADYFANCDDLYISFDVDSMDSETVSNGTGTPVSNGLSLPQTKELVNLLFEKIPQINYFEITEINPLLDTQGNSMAEAAFDVLKIALNHLDKKNNW